MLVMLLFFYFCFQSALAFVVVYFKLHLNKANKFFSYNNSSSFNATYAAGTMLVNLYYLIAADNNVDNYYTKSVND